MSLSILNNIAALYAQNNLNSTQAMLQNTLQQLSSGSRINSGANDPSGLAVSNGMAANVAALTQSATNATSDIGRLQTADGALAQVTSLLDQATTLATEASGGTLTDAQLGSANQEYQNILTQIANIGAHTNFNSNQVTNSAVNTVGRRWNDHWHVHIHRIRWRTHQGQRRHHRCHANRQRRHHATHRRGPEHAGPVHLDRWASTDTLASNITFTIGGEAQRKHQRRRRQRVMPPGIGQLTTAGLTNTVSGNVIDITGPTNGADAACRRRRLHRNIPDLHPRRFHFAAGSYGTVVATAGEPASASLVLAGDTWDTRTATAPRSVFSGTIILDQAGQVSKTITIHLARWSTP